ncbi:hypothetical protein [Tetragenococcus halophilus]|uniref:hypothetical protein n=1 Tax=Tetragenococcus halophilus TaxID=51669 RepID=UPI0030D188F1
MEEKISYILGLNTEFGVERQTKTSEFQPELEKLFAFNNRAINQPVDLNQLYTEISIGTSVDFDEEIYAIIPYGQEIDHTFIIYQNTAKIVDLGTDIIVDQFLYYYWKVGFIEYKKTVEEFLSLKVNSIPLSCENFSLIPFSISTNPKRVIWVNPGRMNDLSFPFGQRAIVSLVNNFVFYLDRKAKAIYEKMHRAFLVHGIIKRYAGKMPDGWRMGLLEYLEISSSCVIRKAINGLTFLEIPGYGKDFYGKCIEIHDKMIQGNEKQQILSELEISE